ncbi:hypothetical protein [Paenibacillus cisolokensis]|uniref:hypothetical protein n=1 Tax=Paenibacillus cisolokensis TaxID=1658519 RepID=UPI001FD42400|nr:hypothetical protein [Paenibacillus cisolokensis]
MRRVARRPCAGRTFQREQNDRLRAEQDQGEQIGHLHALPHMGAEAGFAEFRPQAAALRPPQAVAGNEREVDGEAEQHSQHDGQRHPPRIEKLCPRVLAEAGAHAVRHIELVDKITCQKQQCQHDTPSKRDALPVQDGDDGSHNRHDPAD